MNRGSIFWGIVLLLLGGLLLMQNLGLIPPTVSVWSIFWSLILVAAGVFMLLRSMGRGTSLREEVVRIPREGVQQATLRFHHGAGELRVDGNAAPDELISGTFAGGLDSNVQRSPEGTTIDLRVPSGNFPMFGPFDRHDGFNWTVGLNPNIPLMLDFEVGASRSLINLRDTQVKDLRLQTGASATEIEFPARAGETRGYLRSGAASVEVRVPEGVSARIRARGGLASINIDAARFPLISGGGSSAGSEYRSPDYDMAANRLDLDIETGVGSVSVR